MEIRQLIDRGNIVSTDPAAHRPGCYLGNSVFGSVMDVFGLNVQPKEQTSNPRAGRSQLMHMNHWGRFSFVSEAMSAPTTADYILPLLRIYWEHEPQNVSNYRQEQRFYDGTLSTAFTLGTGERVSVTSWFDRTQNNLAGFRIGLSEGTVSILLSAVTEFIPYPFLYKKLTRQTVESAKAGDCWEITVTCGDTVGCTSSRVYLYTDADVEQDCETLRLTLQAGETTIFLSYGEPADRETRENSFSRSTEDWNETWEKTGWFDFSDDNAQKVWVRSMAYLLSTYDGPADLIQPTNGLTGNMFPFHFVQDLEYIAPALMMTGHTKIVKNWVEKFAGEIPAMREYAKRLWPETEGVYPPWELPFGSIEGYHVPSVPVIYCYEPHNVGYLCRLAAEAAEFVGDETWTEQVALPLIRECAAFYRAACRKGEDGKWHMKWSPCVGQDEAGGRNKEDYLCSMVSAKYCFQQAVKVGLIEYQDYLDDGLAFDSLRSETGVLHTLPGADDFGKQKHPVQMDGLAFLPVESKPQPEERAAYAARRDLTERAKEPFYFGWTLGEFLLAGANLGDAAGFACDWEQIRESNYTDPQWVQIYETSGETEKSFYLTTHGMILQSMIRCYVNDYWGKLQIGACPAFEGKVAFGNIATRFGIVSGTVENGVCDYNLYTHKEEKL